LRSNLSAKHPSNFIYRKSNQNYDGHIMLSKSNIDNTPIDTDIRIKDDLAELRYDPHVRAKLLGISVEGRVINFHRTVECLAHGRIHRKTTYCI